MRNGATGAVTSVGKIFFVDAPMGLPAATCRTLGRSQKPPTTGLASYTFQEYFAQPRNFLTSATWSDMVATDHLRGGGAEHRPAGIAAECCDHGDWRHGDKVNGSSATDVLSDMWALDVAGARWAGARHAGKPHAPQGVAEAVRVEWDEGLTGERQNQLPRCVTTREWRGVERRTADAVGEPCVAG